MCENQLIFIVFISENFTFSFFQESLLTHRKMSASQSSLETKIDFNNDTQDFYDKSSNLTVIKIMVDFLMATRGQFFFLNMKITQCSFQRAKSLSQSYLKNYLLFTNFVTLNYLHISYFIFLMHLLYGIQQFTASALKIKHWNKTRSEKSGIHREDLETYYSFIHVYLFFYKVRIHKVIRIIKVIFLFLC